MARYKMRTLKDGHRVKVVEQMGFEGHIVRLTTCCTGCTEVPENTAAPDRGPGCEECGYTGRRREEHFVPFDIAAYDAAMRARL